MNVSSKENIRTDSASLFRVIRIFLLGGFFMCIIMCEIWGLGIGILDHSIFNLSLSKIGLLFVFGMIAPLAFLFFPLIAGVVLATFGYIKMGRIPLWYIFVMWPICSIAGYIQQKIITRFFWDDPADISYFWGFLLPIILLYLLACWQLSRKITIGEI